MISYVFYDHDERGNEIPLSENSFLLLMDICFKYAEMFDMYFSSKTYQMFPELEKFQIKEIKTTRNLSAEEMMYYPYLYKRYFECNESSKKALLNISKNLWSFLDAWGYENPENLEFVRSDGSCFFSAIIHEGEARFFPRPGEEISDFLDQVHWFKIEC